METVSSYHILISINELILQINTNKIFKKDDLTYKSIHVLCNFCSHLCAFLVKLDPTCTFSFKIYLRCAVSFLSIHNLVFSSGLDPILLWSDNCSLISSALDFLLEKPYSFWLGVRIILVKSIFFMLPIFFYVSPFCPCVSPFSH